MKTEIDSILLYICAFLFIFPQVAYPEKYFFRNYSVEEGLPHPSVTAIFQDKDGYLWFGTNGGGVSKFDGRIFTNYSIRDGLVDNAVTSIFQDKKDNLWFTTMSGVSSFDGENWKTLESKEKKPLSLNFWCGLEDSKGRLWFGGRYIIAMLEADSLSIINLSELGFGEWVHSMIEDRKGNIWVGTSEGAHKYNGEDWTTYKIKNHGQELNDTTVASIAEDRAGNLWFGCPGFVSKYDGTEWESFIFGPGYKGYRFLAGSICEDIEGKLWFGQYHPKGYTMQEKGVIKLDGGKLSFFTTENGLVHNQICSLFKDSEGNLWLGTNGRGVCKFGGEKCVTYTTADGLASDQVEGSLFCNGILEDSKNNIWCLSKSGISRFDGKKWLAYTTENVLKDNMIYSVCEDSKGNIWFGGQNTVYKYDGRRFTDYPQEETGLYFRVESILDDDEGKLWFGSSHHWISMFDGNKWTSLANKEKLKDFIETSAMFKDSRGNIWSSFQGVVRFDGEKAVGFSPNSIIYFDKEITVYTQDSILRLKHNGQDWKPYKTEPRTTVNREIDNYFKGDKFAGWWIWDILEDRQGIVWFGTPQGISKYDGENWTNYTKEDGLVDNEVVCIFEDSKGNLWFGTIGHGISRFNDNKFTNYTTENGLSSNVCHYIFEDKGYIYIGTSTGLNRFDGDRFTVITAKEGLASSELTNSYLRDSKGNLWLGTARGLTKYTTALERPNTVPPPVHITGVSLFGEDISLAENHQLKHKENNLRFDYVGICFTSPEDVVYRYFLEGLDNYWIETRENSVSYPYLPAGKYTFRVTASNNDGVWSEGQAELSFEILPPFWDTTWFKSSIIAVILLVLWGWYQTRTRYMRKRNEELSREVTDRKRAEESLQYALSEVEQLKGRLEAENIYLQEEIKVSCNFEDIISCSEKMQDVLAKVEQVTETDATVLILGETGTGKELIARAVHNISSRKDRPLVKVNCAALPTNLIESELFGHEKGAFTGAHSRKTGRFELADGGTIFLDEIGDLPMELQSKLLRVLQEGEFERLGSSHTIKVDVRVIAATNRDLEKAIERREFRQDLYYRLNVFPIQIPPLREHKEDIPLLVNHLVKKYCAKTGKVIESIPQRVMDALVANNWPGNVRELENVVERAVIVSRGNTLEPGEWMPKVSEITVSSAFPTIEELERDHIIKALELTNWRVSGENGASKILGLKSTTLDARMKKLGIKRKR